MELAELIQTVALYALPVLFAITAHEAAHGYAARYFGDDTAWKLGRVTLNPTNHIDPIGTIVMPLLLYWATSGTMLFGYAKPVPVRFGNLRNPKRDMVWVALAGPGSNFAQALLWGVAFYLLKALDVQEPFFLKMCQGGMLVNAVMFAFNMSAAPAGRWACADGIAADATGLAGVALRAVRIFHRHGLGANGHREHLVDAAADDTDV